MNDLTLLSAFNMGISVAVQILRADRTNIELKPMLELLRSVSEGNEILSNVDEYPNDPDIRRFQIEAEQAMATELLRQYADYFNASQS